MKKPKFFQAVLKPIKGNVLEHVYPHEFINKYPTTPRMTMTDRMGSEEAKCPDCGKNEWMLLANEQVAVKQGGKPYIECLNCGYITHL